MALTEPQFDLLSHLGSTETGLFLQYMRHERGRTGVVVGDRKFQPRTADALLEQGLIEVIAENQGDPKEGVPLKICRLSAKGWKHLGIPVPESHVEVITVDEFLRKELERKERAENQEPPQLVAMPDYAAPVTRYSVHTPFTKKHVSPEHRRARRKMERASRRRNRVRR